MPVAAAVLGSAVIGAGASIIGSNRAANASQRATDQATALQREQYNQTRQDQLPYMQAGYSVLPALTSRFTPQVDWGQYAAQPAVQQAWSALSPEQQAQFGSPAAFGQSHYQQAAQGGQAPDLTAFTTQPGPQAGERPEIQSRPANDAFQAQARPQTAAFAPQVRQEAQSFQPAQRPAITAYQAPQQAETAPTTGGQAQGYGGYNGPGTGGQAATTTSAPSYGDTGGGRPAISQFQQASRPGVSEFSYAERPDLETADVSIGQFQRQPDYEFARQQGQDAVLANQSLFGLQNGAAIRRVSEYNQDYANTRYGDWRDYVTGQTNTRNALRQQGYDSDRNASLNAWAQREGLTQAGFTSDQDLAANVWSQINQLRQAGYTADADRLSRDWQAQLGADTQIRTTGMNNATSLGVANIGAATSRYNTDTSAALDRERMASDQWYRQNQLQQDAYQFDTNLGADLYRYNTTRGDQNYQFDQNLGADLYRFNASRGDANYNFDQTLRQNQSQFDTSRLDQNYQFDTTLRQDLFNSDRDYNRSVYNDTTNALLQTAQLGQGSAQSVGNIGANYAGSASNALLTNGANRGNAYLSGASGVANALNSGLNAYSYWQGFNPSTQGGSGLANLSQAERAYMGLG